jgi:predicted DNA-binding transcriptional regulator AlpA
MPEDRIVSDADELQKIVGLTKRVAQMRAGENKFPKPIPLGFRTDGRVSKFGFRMSDLQRWIREKAREQKATA